VKTIYWIVVMRKMTMVISVQTPWRNQVNLVTELHAGVSVTTRYSHVHQNLLDVKLSDVQQVQLAGSVKDLEMYFRVRKAYCQTQVTNSQAATTVVIFLRCVQITNRIVTVVQVFLFH
jgi:hypothetical protein